MPKLARMPTDQTASRLRALAARRRQQEKALDTTRTETVRLLRRAVHVEEATPAALARLVGWNREYVSRVVHRKRGANDGN